MVCMGIWEVCVCGMHGYMGGVCVWYAWVYGRYVYDAHTNKIMNMTQHIKVYVCGK